MKKDVVPEIKEYIANLDIDALLGKLSQSLSDIPEETIFLVRIAHLLLKEGIAAGLTLSDIASLVARMDEDEPSKLEQAIQMAEDNAFSNIQSKSGRLNMSDESNRNDKRVGNFSSVPPMMKKQSISIPLRRVSEGRECSSSTIGERDRSSSSESDGSDGGASLQRHLSVFSPIDYAISRSPVSVARDPSDEGDLTRQSSSDSLNEQMASADRGATDESNNNYMPQLQSRVADKDGRFARVASFAGFDSAAIYDVGKQSSIHHVSTSLQRERRRLISKTNEFRQLRWKLASDAVRAMISRSKKST